MQLDHVDRHEQNCGLVKRCVLIVNDITIRQTKDDFKSVSSSVSNNAQYILQDLNDPI